MYEIGKYKKMDLSPVKLDLYKFENITRLVILELPPLKLHLAKKYRNVDFTKRKHCKKVVVQILH